MRIPKTWFVTFRAKNRSKWIRYSDRYYEFEATSFDQAMKTTIDLFGRDWENLYSEEDWNDEAVLKRLSKADYRVLPYAEHRKEVERIGRIPFKTFREKEVKDAKTSK